MIQLIVTGTGTGIGKTVVSCALARALAERGKTKGIKPYETGVTGIATDAAALEVAAGMLCTETYFRAADPVAPGACEDVPSTEEMASRIERELVGCHGVVESAGGLLVPLSPGQTFADLAARLALPIILVTYDGLGTLSHTLTAVEAAQARSLSILAIVLDRFGDADPSQGSNERLLRELQPFPLITVSEDAQTLDAAAQEILRLAS